jgi:D-alanyl-D-alanine carboxypeptidase-like protein
MSELGEKQRLFAKLVGDLLQHIYLEGYECTLDWVYRPPEVAQYYASLGIGIRNSLHILKLAIDLNLFRNDVWLRSSDEHRPIGEWWEKQHILCRWGGRWGDGNHYSLEHEGRK